MTTSFSGPPEPLPMAPLRESNDLVGDPAALDHRIDADGYLFFRQVLHADPIARLKRQFIDSLADLGVVDRGAEEPVWNGASLDDYPLKVEALHEARVWEDFAAHPAIKAFIEGVLGKAAFWVPVVEYRLQAPTRAAPDDPFIARHQDEFYNQGIACRTCWVPLMDIDAWTGGLALAGDMNKVGILHDLSQPPQYPIPRTAIPDSAWIRSDYRAGDLVMFGTTIPHTGLPNYSDRFRLSMDIRVMPAEGLTPVLGEIVTADASAVVVRQASGETVRLRLTDDSYVRGNVGRRLPLDEVTRMLPPGSPVMASHQNGVVVMIRPPR